MTVEPIPINIGNWDAQKKKYLQRFECESEEWFCKEYPDPERARAVFASYLTVIEEALEMLGWGGRSRPYPTDEDIMDLIRKQRSFIVGLNALNETKKKATKPQEAA